MFTGRNSGSNQVIQFGPIAGGGGWKLDVFDEFGQPIRDPYADAWEATLDEILPCLLSFVSDETDWADSMGGSVSFWTVVTSHRIAAGVP